MRSSTASRPMSGASDARRCGREARARGISAGGGSKRVAVTPPRQSTLMFINVRGPMRSEQSMRHETPRRTSFRPSSRVQQQPGDDGSADQHRRRDRRAGGHGSARRGQGRRRRSRRGLREGGHRRAMAEAPEWPHRERGLEAGRRVLRESHAGLRRQRAHLVDLEDDRRRRHVGQSRSPRPARTSARCCSSTTCTASPATSAPGSIPQITGRDAALRDEGRRRDLERRSPTSPAPRRAGSAT